VFNLIICGDGEQWSESQPWSINATRFLEHSCNEAIELFKGSSDLTALESLPTIITGEWGNTSDQIVRFGNVRNVKPLDGSIQFSFDEESHAFQEILEMFDRELQLVKWETCRSHWAVKSGDLPEEFSSRLIRGTYKEFPYEIVISYASEDIAYVNQVASLRAASGVRMFFAPFDEPELWGKSLSKRLDAIYRNLGRYCLMFVSDHYALKVWPNFERKVAMERAIQQAADEREDYILACRFDETEIPGMAPDVVYQDLREKTPAQVADLVVSKLRKKMNLLRK